MCWPGFWFVKQIFGLSDKTIEKWLEKCSYEHYGESSWWRHRPRLRTILQVMYRCFSRLHFSKPHLRSGIKCSIIYTFLSFAMFSRPVNTFVLHNFFKPQMRAIHAEWDIYSRLIRIFGKQSLKLVCLVWSKVIKSIWQTWLQCVYMCYRNFGTIWSALVCLTTASR